MPLTKLQDLLPSSMVSSQSRSEVLQQLTVVSSGEQASSGSSSADGLSNLQGSLQDVNGQLSALTSQITSLGSVQQTQVSATQDNTQALTQSTSSSGSGSSIGGTVGDIASSLLGGGLGLSPIITGLLSLFGGSSGQVSTVLPRFALPSPIDYSGGINGSGQVVPVDYGQTGQPRTQAASTSQQVNIQVNAMDSQSFLDHSDDIANAVKAAILSSHSLNDVISEL